jgi:hypothetical protein
MLVKDLPDNPIDFLISKLQGKKKKAPAIARPTSGGTKTALSKPTAAKTSTAGTSSISNLLIEFVFIKYHKGECTTAYVSCYHL